MNLRTRLFLWISLTFAVAGGIDYALEEYTTTNKITAAEGRLRQKIIETSEEKRKGIENYLASAIAEKQSMLDFMLRQLTNFFLQVEHFAPITENEESGTWGDTATVLANNKWIDLIQNTIEGKVASCIVPRPESLDFSYTVPINDDCAWVVMADELKEKLPLIGVRIPIAYKPGYQQPESEQIVIRKGTLPEGYLLFSVEELLLPSSESSKAPIFQPEILSKQGSVLLPWTEGFTLDLNGFYHAFTNARNYLKQGLGKPTDVQKDEIRAWIEKELAAKGKNLDNIPLYPEGYSSFSSGYIQQRLGKLTMQYNQIYMIWVLASLFDSGVFGSDMFKSPAPLGISVNRLGEAQGTGIHTVDCFYPQPFLDDAAYYQKNHDPDSISNLGSSIAVFRGPDHHVFLGNTAQLLAVEKNIEKAGYLTLAVDADLILQKLVQTMSQMALIVHNNEVFGAYTKSGERVDFAEQKALPLPQLLANKTGTIHWNNEDYFFSQMTPFPGIDLHFIMLNPVSVEFAFTKYVVDGAISVVNSILFNVHLIGFSTILLVLILLHNIALRITRPVTRLAQATKAIGEGHLESVDLPKPLHPGRGDEVEILCTAFEQMVTGLKEKEKVKAVLNKVVSQEIAQEILKGNIHLGGEEMKVTVLFADIRNFTHMTQNMKPQEVVDLLNACMTKISNIIDHNGGVIDKYVGDSTMALFGAPIPDPNSAMQAITSALKIVEEITRWNVERKDKGLPLIEMGIGIHTGNVLAGNMGAENRLNYTVIGSNVNLASRLCSSAQGMEIRITKETLHEPHVQERTVSESLGPITLKGFDQPIEVFSIRGGR